MNLEEERFALLTASEGTNEKPIIPEFVGRVLRNFQDDKEAIEDTIYTTLKAIMEDPEAKPEARVKAASEAAELLRLKGKGVSTTVIAQNAQINNQIAENPALQKSLAGMAQGMGQLIDARDSGVRSVNGGAGS